jgi:hypothetical protein
MGDAEQMKTRRSATLLSERANNMKTITPKNLEDFETIIEWSKLGPVEFRPPGKDEKWRTDCDLMLFDVFDLKGYEFRRKTRKQTVWIAVGKMRGPSVKQWGQFADTSKAYEKKEEAEERMKSVNGTVYPLEIEVDE